MNLNEKRETAIGEIERFGLANETTPLVITFAEGDSYVCRCDTGEWEDNGEWSSEEDARNLPGYEEWYEIGLLVIKTIVPGPNKDPRYRYIDISRKHMPCRVTAGDTVLYEELPSDCISQRNCCTSTTVNVTSNVAKVTSTTVKVTSN